MKSNWKHLPFKIIFNSIWQRGLALSNCFKIFTLKNLFARGMTCTGKGSAGTHEYFLFTVFCAVWHFKSRWHLQGKLKHCLTPVMCARCTKKKKYSLEWIILQPLQDSLSQMTKDSKTRQRRKQMSNTGDINSKMSPLTVRPWQEPHGATQHNYEVQMYKSNFPTLLPNPLHACFWW